MRKIGLLCLLMTLTACVTINIYFPAAEAQKAADKIIDEVWQLKDGQKPEPDKAPATQPDAGTEPKKAE
jgi:hypothetical protein